MRPEPFLPDSRGQKADPCRKAVGSLPKAIDRKMQRATIRRLEMNHAAAGGEDLRICFVWKDGGADDVEVVDDH